MRAGTWEVLEAFVSEHGIRFGSGSRYRPGDPGFHGRERARDFGGSNSDAAAISRLFAPIARSHPHLIPEMFGFDGVGIDEGRPYQEPGHTGDHTHVAIGAGVTLDQLRAAAAGQPVGAPVDDLAGAVPIAASSSNPLSFTESGIRRAFLIAGGVGMVAWGVALLGIDLRGAAVGAVVKRIGRIAK